LDDDDRRIAVVDFVLNRETLLVADSEGTIRGWFPVDRGDVTHLKNALPTNDRLVLAPVHELPSRDEPITSLGISERTRMIAAGYADGVVRVFHVTTGQHLIDVHPAKNSPVDFVAMAPKDNGIIATSGEGMWRCEFEPGHPETTWASLFADVWFEGEAKPDVKWQSSFGGVGPEMKLSLWPLVFGTLKATVYAMLFGAPLALLAAIYTSEFMQPRTKAAIKPVVEMMASLPSVVLGFLAALVFAPVVERAVPMVLSCFVTIPFVYVLSAFLWQLLPHHKSLALQRYRFPLCLVLIPLGLALAWQLGPIMEDLFFAGDIKRWLDGQVGSGTGAWMIMLFPLTAVGMAIASGLLANPWLRHRSGGWSRKKFAVINLAKFAVASVATLAIAWILSAAMTAVGLDPRGTYVGTYDQRNALVVGFVMGFAIIPIIYTIAEDALSTVPHHLRTGSLGAGATPWQTATRIVIPTAMSGLFSAMMVGLGRAVGETMIVLMAAGNTPVREWNVFNGFRTLAANIAVELPEAVQGETHYRTLFLCALTLFVMTFFVNTLAELVRLRFRKRAVQL
jgi:phosphate transport system permease protein